MDKDLLFKYNIPGPRYTSYPTVPYWQNTPPTEAKWRELVMDAFTVSNQKEGISLYIHLPSCESLCTYCGCDTHMTVDHQVEKRYIDTLLKEWKMYLSIFGASKPLIKEMHLGGSTPTFFSPVNLKRLVYGLLENVWVHPQPQFSFEAHPTYTTDEHLRALYEVGFRRVSIAVQDFNPLVLAAINRHQTFGQVSHLTHKAREIGYTSVNYDIVYGLPHQKACYMMETMLRVIQLKPDQVAFYSDAHAPDLKPKQNNYAEQDLPDPDKKMAIYETGRNALELAGYHDIGMDHFALETDYLYKAQTAQRLHHNFMGYTDSCTQLLIGLGASAISDTWWGYVQNEKKVEDYYKRIEAAEMPICRGHVLTREDLILRRHILHLTTRFQTSWTAANEVCNEIYAAIERLSEMEFDELIELKPYHLRITDKGKPFVRNVCMAFDAGLWASQPLTSVFSNTV